MIKSGALAIGLAGLVFLAATGAVGASRPDGFDFNTYEFATQGQDTYGQAPSAEMTARAQAFVDAHHPSGSSANAAVRDFKRAGAACRIDRRTARTVTCSYARPSHGMTGLIGSALWRIDIHSVGQSDQIASITVRRTLMAD